MTPAARDARWLSSGPLRNQFAGAAWLAREDLEDPSLFPMSELGRDVADLLGFVYRGLYHLGATVTHKRTDWSNPTVVRITVPGELATVDGQELAHLVMGAALVQMRLAIRASARDYLQLQFTRNTPDGHLMYFGTIKTPESAAVAFRANFPQLGV